MLPPLRQAATETRAGSGTWTIVFEIDNTDPLGLKLIVSRIQIYWIAGNAMVEPAAPSTTERAQVPLPGVGLAWRSARLANMSL